MKSDNPRKKVKLPDGPELVYVEAVLMPNGEIISHGKTIGWADKIDSVARILEVLKDRVVIEKVNRNHD